jgi:hypothetical protein
MTDVADTEQLLRLIQSVPSPKAEPSESLASETPSFFAFSRASLRLNPSLHRRPSADPRFSRFPLRNQLESDCLGHTVVD